MDQPQPTPVSKKANSVRSSKNSTRGSNRDSKKGSNTDSSRGTNMDSKRSSRRAMPIRQKKSYRSKAARWLEPRLLIITTGVTLLGVFLQVIAISTDSWLVLDAPGGVYRNASGRYLVEAYTGLWRLCRVEISKSISTNGKLLEDKVSSCERHSLFSTTEEVRDDKDHERNHEDFDVKDMIKIDYTRTAIAFTVIAIVIMIIGHAFAFYALKRPRYIIKRLAALLHFMAAACLLVLNEVFVKTIEHEENKHETQHVDAVTHFGYSFVLSWLVFVFFVLGGLIFLFMSHKKKAEYADSNEALEDEPMEIFRR